MGGRGLYDKIKVEFPLSAGRIILTTGDIADPDTKELLTEVANPVLLKPSDFRELEQLVLSITNRPTDGAKLPSDPFDPGLPTSA